MRRALGAALFVGLAPLAQERAAAPELEELRLLVALDRGAEALALSAHLVRPGAAWAEDGEALALVARALVATGAEEQALAFLRDARPARAAGAAELERVRTLLVLDRLEEAFEALTVERDGGRALRLPEEPDALLIFARVQVRRGRHEGVEEACRTFLARAPHHPEASSAWHLLAGEALARGDAAGARQAFDRAREEARWSGLVRARELQALRSPDDPLPRLGLALLWLEAGEHERARALLAELVLRHPGEARAWFHLGEAERALGHSPLAAYERALALAPDYPEALLRRGLLLLGSGTEGAAPDAARGRADLERLIERLSAGEAARYRDAWWALARERAAAGDADAAARLSARYRELGGERAL